MTLFIQLVIPFILTFEGCRVCCKWLILCTQYCKGNRDSGFILGRISQWVRHSQVRCISCLFTAYENIRFSSLFAAGDVSRGGTSATQRQKFHTDDVKSVQNPVRSANNWLTEYYIVLVIVYECQTKDKRPQRSNVNAKNLEQKSQYLWNIRFSRRSVWVLLELVGRWTQHITKIDQKTRKIGQICIWNPMTTGFISCRRSFSRNVPSGEEWGETDVFAG